MGERASALPVTICLLAGCLATSGDAGTSPAHAAPWVLEGCADFTGQFPRPEEEGAVPPPLTPTAFFDAPGTSALFVVAARCTMAASPGHVVHIMLGAMRVDAPPAMRPDSNETVVLLAVAWARTDDPELADAWRAGGLTSVKEAPISWELEDGQVRTGRAVSGDVSLDVTSVSPENQRSKEVARFFFTSGDRISGAMDWQMGAPSARRGTASLADGTSGYGGHFWGKDYGYEISLVSQGQLGI